MRLVIDIEADNLYQDVTTIHCIVAYDIDTSEVHSFTSKPLKGTTGTIEDGLEFMTKATTIILHNGISYDLPVMAKLHDYNYTGEVMDTLLISQLLYPDLLGVDIVQDKLQGRDKGSHSLRAWGRRLGYHKGDYGEQEDAWDFLTQAMLDYCITDTKVTAKLWEHFVKKGLPNQQCLTLEHEFAKIISRQEIHGVYFDIPKAQKLHVELVSIIDDLEEKLQLSFPPLDVWVPKNYPKNPYKKDGTKASVLLKHEEKGYHFNDKEEYGVFEKLVFNPGSRAHITRWLQDKYDWKPEEFTDKDNVIVNEDVLNGLDYPEAKELAFYFTNKKLLAMLAEGKAGWLKLVDEKTSRIHGRTSTLGAVSRRATYSKPNLSQVPSTRAYKGEQVRSLFTVPKGKCLVGVDLSGIELRLFGHFLSRYDNGEYSQLILEGDIHTHNQQSAGLPTRDMAKTFIYGMLYGAGDEKTGLIVGKGRKEGRRLKQNFFKAVPAYKKLVDAVTKAFDTRGYINALDGHPLHVRSAHSALNTLLQSAAALIAKQWVIIADTELQSKYTYGVDYAFVLNIVDEVQVECLNTDIGEDVKKILIASITKAGEVFNLRIRLDGEGVVSTDWSLTH